MWSSDSDAVAAGVCALYHDGLTTRGRKVELQMLSADGRHVELLLHADGFSHRITIDAGALAGHVADAHRLIDLPGGASLEVIDGGVFDAARAKLGLASPSDRIRGMERSWHVALGALLAIVLGSFAFLTWGVPALAARAMQILPLSVDARVGSEAMALLDRGMLKPTTLTTTRQQQVRGLFAQVAAGAGDGAYRLELRGGGPIGANALALPSGIVILTDELVAAAQHDDELRAVLAHEVGHLVRRHAMRKLVQGSASALLMLGLLGDVNSASSLVAAVPGFLIDAAYSRDLEREADEFAIAWMRRHGVDPAGLGNLLTRVAAKSGDGEGSLLSSHPGLAERVRATSNP